MPDHLFNVGVVVTLEPVHVRVGDARVVAVHLHPRAARRGNVGLESVEVREREGHDHKLLAASERDVVVVIVVHVTRNAPKDHDLAHDLARVAFGV
eukprot:CAMPEP_0182603446 /NCGR_PEP_ID=MMETSP1324-20130603/92499_1 /TAXON_ID=236786 /ORGANISM="Florenciella sp., Strain RCC1587" /LENGTH=95 /DNA_ID=CAMNT_0024821377 /DNA_START=872 /DNA_END=1159 /DNA_ORIENTATION=+